eukprot:CAMPEP_0184874080 /NCGR_PEP_ID=MMETSP0580-20130426/42195_1 /TAXON_ID=1118495 /ORGANISM="Dactyliosolen fragilissimus" /LENGTH=916 /DNA_ID=CAMNT_0027377051 /DNA_START=36 /DNA_END=2783 /DNA_ORIENTATION=+
MTIKKIAGRYLKNEYENGKQFGKNAEYANPIITPPIKIPTYDENIQQEQQVLLVPCKDAIHVLSLETGSLISEMTTQGMNEDEPRNIFSITLAKISSSDENMKHGGTDYKGMLARLSANDDSSDFDHMSAKNITMPEFPSTEWIILAASNDGLIFEWTLDSILSHSPIESRSHNGTPLIPYRRALTISFDNNETKGGGIYPLCGTISHLSCAGYDVSRLYALVADAQKKDLCHLVSVNIPEYIDNRSLPSNSNLDIIPSTSKLLASFKKDDHNQRILKYGKHKQKSKLPAVPTLAMYKSPISLLTCLSSPNDSISKHKQDVFIIVVQSRGFVIFYATTPDPSSSKGIVETDLVHFPRKKLLPSISSASISPHGKDLAIGYEDGKIDVLIDIFKLSAKYLEVLSEQEGSDKTPTIRHPAESMLTQTSHWHAHEVKTMCFIGSSSSRVVPSLVSGGEESVIVFWSANRLNHPNTTIPRISKGAINQIISNEFSASMEIVVFCLDNTIQLLHGHNNAIRWKKQGIASASNEPVHIAQPETSKFRSLSKIDAPPLLMIDPRTNLPMLTRLRGAPGFIHWFDLKSGQVVGELEVVAYNRVSRKSSLQAAYPRPTVTHLVMSGNGHDMITVDTMLTENKCIGAHRRVKVGDHKFQNMSFTTTIRFWAWEGNSGSEKQRRMEMPYELIAAMPAPHSINGEISSLAISPNGLRACSLSIENNSFHLWGKSLPEDTGKNKLTTPSSPLWKRLYKITTPAGYSNLNLHANQNNNLVSFSADGSVLIVSYGSSVTLWDHAHAQILNTISFHQNILDVQFMKASMDTILAVGKTSISAMPPFKHGHLGEFWSYQMSKSFYEKKAFSEHRHKILVAPFASSKEVLVAFRILNDSDTKGKDKAKDQSKIMILDASTGEQKKRLDGTPYCW